MLYPILEYAHHLVRQTLQAGDTAVDATVGTGRDTAFLAELVGEHGRVYGFDIQEDAIRQATARLTASGLRERATLYHAGHERLTALLPAEAVGTVRAVMFNLGYLPRGDHAIITRPETTLAALKASLNALSPDGIITVVLYKGHHGANEEVRAVHEWASLVDRQRFDAVSHRQLNRANDSPELVVVRRLR